MGDDQSRPSRFISIDDVSDSDEQDMEAESASDEDQRAEPHEPDAETGDEVIEGPPRKKQMQDKVRTGPEQSTTFAKWSNPDPYTVLPPPDESRKKRKDVVKLIRKARIAATQDTSAKNAVVNNDDFISLDFGDDFNDDDTHSAVDEDRAGRGKGVPGAPSGPAADFSHRQTFHQTLDKGAPGTKGTTVPASILGPPPNGLPDRPPPLPQSDSVWPPPTKDAALGSRKRTHDDEIKPDTSSQPRTRSGKEYRKKGASLGAAVLEHWLPRDGENPTPWNTADHSGTANMGLW